MANITLSISTSTRRQLERVKAMAELRSLSEVFRRALATYDVLVEAESKGQKVMLQDEDGTLHRLVGLV